MTRIATDQHLVTLVNVFTVAPDRQQALVDLRVAATEQTMCHQPAYVSANITAAWTEPKSSTTPSGAEPRTSRRAVEALEPSVNSRSTLRGSPSWRYSNRPPRAARL